ncbi:epimerase [Actinorhabdospora filicis]|uniref:Epimerase n=1 Tax=Actinorhabdospora filicis TaxID=1785913 RepID=A0A9W6SS48_9ACTN|nr:NAD-dependent epimerase/dehydratase family protein [Actinorhabdospora filicis]GLZ81348.1 epimerase [Actinorhabdospora filicis]
MARTLVTGGAGFIGSHLVRALLARGDEVVAIDNLVTGRKENLPEHERFAFVEADVSEGLPVDGRFDNVLHFACPASPVDFTRIPIEILKVDSIGTFHALDRAAADGARFILASTSEVYGDPLVHPQPESYWGNVNPIGVRAVYDEAKRFSEAATFAYHRDRGVDVGVVRIFNAYGPNMRADDGRAVPTFITQALRGEPLTVAGDGTQTRSLCYIDDLVRGILLLLESGETGPVNCGTTFEVSMLELAALIVELTGSDSPIVHVDRPADDPSQRRPDLSKIRDRLGYEPLITLEQGLQATIGHFRTDISAISGRHAFARL